ncbi:hypothetical protein JVT61DRAFT_15554 [Boletus reticuloceps]|uniref:Uncharacterized protein n=1 Tax=Boletus reticuloceps TaxID=495285 RepID=A0A8I3A229_9AGAM|nr:hypothetical protein JVT61DRAFT_15554 [Boletus reticuloceps]
MFYAQDIKYSEREEEDGSDSVRQGDLDQSTSLNNLAVDLSIRYEQVRVMEDLDEAIALSREALDLCPEGHPDRSMSLSNLATRLSIRSSSSGSWRTSTRLLLSARKPLAFTRESALIGRHRWTVATYLSTRYKQLGVVEDLEEALGRETLKLRPEGHPNRSTSLNNVAPDLSARYKQLGGTEDLDEAIALGREALDLLQKGHLDRSTSLDNLANRLCDRFARLKQSNDKEVMDPKPPSDYSSNTWPSYHHRLSTSSPAVDAFSVCLRRGSPAKAVELLEQGRRVFWSQLTRLRSPLDDVTTSGMERKELADDFTRLAFLIRNTLDSPGGDQHEELYRLNLELQRVVTNIRQLPGLSRFLLPSVFSDLQRAADGGPVIITNVRKYSFDALVTLLLIAILSIFHCRSRWNVFETCQRKSII